MRDGKWYFRTLFVDGQRKQRARTPNEGFFRIQRPSPQDRPVKLKFQAGDIKKEWVGISIASPGLSRIGRSRERISQNRK